MKSNDKQITKGPKRERMGTLHPGEILREEYFKPLRLTPYRLAHELHVPVPRINDIVLEKRAISADTAVRLAKFSARRKAFGWGCRRTMMLIRPRSACRKSWRESAGFGDQVLPLPLRYSLGKLGGPNAGADNLPAYNAPWAASNLQPKRVIPIRFFGTSRECRHRN